jgi:hypothetical protein
MMSLSAMAQNVMSPETLWKLGRVSALGISKDSKNVVYKVLLLLKKTNPIQNFMSFPVNGGPQPKFRKQGSTKGQKHFLTESILSILKR